jgi:anti-sigma B factor antagonist
MSGTDAQSPRLERAPDVAGAAVVELGGELDLAVSSRLRALVDEATADGPRMLVLDVTEVAFMDSSVLREFLRAHRAVEDAGGRTVLAGAQPSVRRLLELTGTAGMFTLADSVDAALDDGAS